MSIPSETAQSALAAVMRQAKALGADAADASFSQQESLSVDVRLGELEGVERSESRSLGLRLLYGKRQAGATTSDLSESGLQALAERVAAMAKAAPQDPYCGLLRPDERGAPNPALDLADSARPDAAALETLAREAEDAARAISGITNSSGSGASWSAGFVALAALDGFYATSSATSYGIGVAPLAERDGVKERDYEGRTTRFREDLPDAAWIGQRAGERTIARLGARKIETGKAPVIFENRIAGRLIGPFLGAISGAAVARGVSFLKDKLGERVFAPGVRVEDDPLMARGLASRSFDGEGASGTKRDLIDDGVLTTWLMNASAARQLGLATTGHATLGHGGPPGISSSNVTLAPGRQDLDALMREAGDGLVVTEMFSPALNGNTGDWSVGVAGYWFEGGARAYPVHEVTVAGNLLEMYLRLIPGADLDRRGSLDAPSILVDGLAIGGA